MEVVGINTAEMWIEAQKTGEAYEAVDGDILYSKDRGLVETGSLTEWPLSAWDNRGLSALDDLMSCTWEISPIKYMTVKEAEQKYGICIRE